MRETKFTTKVMADTLTRVYGKDHVSDGERTTLSLLYFLRNLEDEQTPVVDQAQRIVVIDDPSSSLDREALFATHQWLFDTLESSASTSC